MNEYVTRVVIGIMTAGLIILVIPILFFTIGGKIELKVTKREINRYFEFWCQGVVGKMLPRDLVFQVKQQVDRVVNSPEQKGRDAQINDKNGKLVRNTYIICGLSSIGMLFAAMCLAWYTHQGQGYIWFEALLGTFMFGVIEVMIILILFKKYCPMDINMVNKHIMMRIL